MQLMELEAQEELRQWDKRYGLRKCARRPYEEPGARISAVCSRTSLLFCDSHCMACLACVLRKLGNPYASRRFERRSATPAHQSDNYLPRRSLNARRKPKIPCSAASSERPWWTLRGQTGSRAL